MTTKWFTQVEYGFCKALANHAWQKASRWLEVAKGGELVVQLVCRTCGAAREDWLDGQTGRVGHRYYSYPPGYVFELGGKKRPERGTLRLEYLEAFKVRRVRKAG